MSTTLWSEYGPLFKIQPKICGFTLTPLVAMENAYTSRMFLYWPNLIPQGIEVLCWPQGFTLQWFEAPHLQKAKYKHQKCLLDLTYYSSTLFWMQSQWNSKFSLCSAHISQESHQKRTPQKTTLVLKRRKWYQLVSVVYFYVAGGPKSVRREALSMAHKYYLLWDGQYCCDEQFPHFSKEWQFLSHVNGVPDTLCSPVA